MIKKYCKAYHLRDLRQYSNWTERNDDNESELTDDSIVYLWDDFTVVKSPVIPDKGLLFDAITPEWQDFCKTTLKFEIPEDLLYAYQQKQEQENAVSEPTQTAV